MKDLPSRLLAISLVLTATVARAEQVTYAVSGTVTDVDEALSGTFQVGQAFSVVFTYESTTPGNLCSGCTEELGFRDYWNALTAFSIAVGTYSASTPSGYNLLQVANNWSPSIEDVFDVGAGLNGPPVAGGSPLVLIGFVDDSAGVFSNTHLLDVGDLSGWTNLPNRYGSGYLSFAAGGGSPRILLQASSVARIGNISLSVRSAHVGLSRSRASGSAQLIADFKSPVPQRTDLISVTLDGTHLFAQPFQAFFRVGGASTYMLLKKGIVAWFDFEEGHLSVVAPSVNLAGLDSSNGVNVDLRIGTRLGQETIQMIARGKYLLVYQRAGPCE